LNASALEFDHIHIISNTPHESAQWYVDMLGAEVVADTVARGAAQIFIAIGGKTLIIRGARAGEQPKPAPAVQEFDTFSSHNHLGTDHFGFLYRGDLRAFCAELAAQGVTFPVALKAGVDGSLLCYISAPDGVSIELMQAF
jgi:lactoylglutathione lyase